ncbi:hypothetical protein RHMOL_Rhmol04G0077300 [Rhododendron molle]|uniref:Uncharacterized protein n=1 Tax=Rhododendron molle TaxID=49168 RepID=A0ACC0NYB5_RHOML|nr:hypothetical protein RHMOL_Rhmol04G0077300 [Rhododendron molle]
MSDTSWTKGPDPSRKGQKKRWNLETVKEAVEITVTKLHAHVRYYYIYRLLHFGSSPRLGDSYPIDSVRKLAQLANACTQENPLLRPSMRSAVVELMTLSSSTEDWDVGSFYENRALVSLMSER